MSDAIVSIEWEAHPHVPQEHGSDWYWMLGIIGISASVATFILGNVLFGIVILLSVLLMVIHTRLDTANPIPFSISARGIHVDDRIYPYTKLDSYWIDHEHHLGPHLLIRRNEGIDTTLVIPLPEEYVDEIDEFLINYIPEEYMEEPLSKRLFEFFGF